MADIVSLKQQGMIERYHDVFVSLLNQLHLPMPYVLNIFVSKLKEKNGQHLKLFKPFSLLKGFQIARQVEGILLN